MCELKRENYTPGTMYNSLSLSLSLCPSRSLCRTRNIIYDFDSLLKNLMESVREVVVGESLDSRSHMQFMHTQTTLSNLTACQKPEKNNQKKKHPKSG